MSNAPPASAGVTLSVVVPVYNSAESLPELTAALAVELPRVALDYEVILVNDGSRDNSWEIVEQLSRQHDWVRGINLARNYGQHSALICGIRAARNDIVITMDDDLQHPPSQMGALVAKVAEGYDVVYGAPRRLPHSAMRNFLSQSVKWLLAQMTGIELIRQMIAFRAFRTEVREAFSNYQAPNPLLDALLTWGTTRFASVEVDYDPRRRGRSNYTVSKLFNQMLLLVTGYSVRPLRLATWVGFASTVFGLGVLVYVVGRYFLGGGSVPGFPFLASAMAIFAGAQLFAIGIIGEYLAHVFNRSSNQPTYIVRGVAEKPVTAPSEPPKG
jgi:undecaprenyl-phosphate 4-deoxy-4-formamido-L-arabinose transferase